MKRYEMFKDCFRLIYSYICPPNWTKTKTKICLILADCRWNCFISVLFRFCYYLSCSYSCRTWLWYCRSESGCNEDVGANAGDGNKREECCRQVVQWTRSDLTAET